MACSTGESLSSLFAQTLSSGEPSRTGCLLRNEPHVCQPGEGLGNTMNDQSSGTQAEKISTEIAALAGLDIRHLKSRWRELYDTEPPSTISRELLTRAIAYRLQERELGSLEMATRRLLERVADDLSSHRARVSQARKAAPGTLLIREWRGKAHQVTVHDDGVAYHGKRYRSLSEVARLITGTRWSGPLFFGLRKPVAEAHHGAA
jgi:DUF2924 family protein